MWDEPFETLGHYLYVSQKHCDSSQYPDTTKKFTPLWFKNLRVVYNKLLIAYMQNTLLVPTKESFEQPFQCHTLFHFWGWPSISTGKQCAMHIVTISVLVVHEEWRLSNTNIHPLHTIGAIHNSSNNKEGCHLQSKRDQKDDIGRLFGCARGLQCCQ